jgi:hypothetical protein
MRTEYHVTHSVDNAIVGICGDVVEEHFNKLSHVYCRLSLLCTNGIECYQQLIVNSSCMIQEGPNSAKKGANASLSGVYWAFGHVQLMLW